MSPPSPCHHKPINASENLGMAMIYTLVTSAKEWLSGRYCQDADADADNAEEEEARKDEVLVFMQMDLYPHHTFYFQVIVPHGEPVTIDTFSAWRERFEAELALERAKLMPESALTVPKEKKLTGRQWFESGRASAKGAAAIKEEYDEEEEEDVDLDDDDFEDDEEDMLEHYLAEKSDSSSLFSKRTA
ncbi:anoctamin-7-like [Hibiscus syriacus]|uniref:Anoctamin-7-like n=1 Tax=Hibiscus syriacus TaxID=106335 RepID=A0A6A3A558_HIBSY|nr:anoctamin-7-like [Hibiscus syriacus]